MHPYIVSCDLGLLWEKAGFSIPLSDLETFREEVRAALRESIGASEWIPEIEIKEGVEYELTQISVPVISLDNVYTPRQEYELSMTRLVDWHGNDAGYGMRDGTALNLREQIQKIAQAVQATEIALVDDVIFSGSMMERVIKLFAEEKVHVRIALCGIAIGEGVERLRHTGCSVKAVRTYAEVADEICERDFMPGAPLSGRTVTSTVNTGAPYILPFGKPERWASIPSTKVTKFSQKVLRANANFYEGLGLSTKKLPRNILGLEKSDLLIADILRTFAERL